MIPRMFRIATVLLLTSHLQGQVSVVTSINHNT